MGVVMLDIVKPRPDRFLIPLAGLRKLALDTETFAVALESIENRRKRRPFDQRKQRFLCKVSFGIETNGDVIQIFQFGPPFGQAISDRFRGEPGPMFDAIEPLFFDGSDQFSIPHKARCGISMMRVKAEDEHLEDSVETLTR